MPYGNSMQKQSTVDPTFNDLVIKYSKDLETLRDLFQEWNDSDFVCLLEEAEGDLQTVIIRISEGYASQWTSTDKKKKRDAPSNTTSATSALVSRTEDSKGRGGHSGRGRGNRGRGGFSGRGSARGKGRSRQDREERAPKESSGRNWQENATENSLQNEESMWSEQPKWNETQDWVADTKSSDQWNDASQSWAADTKTGQWNETSREKPKKQAGKSGSSWAAVLKKGSDDVKEKPKPKPAPVKEPIASTVSVVSAMLPTTPSVTIDLNSKPKSASASASPAKSPIFKNSTGGHNSPQLVTQTVANPPGLKGKPSQQRVLNQDAPVVMPQTASLSSVGVKFGSLSVEDKGASPPIHRGTLSQGTSPGHPTSATPNQGRANQTFPQQLTPAAMQQMVASQFGFGNVPSVPGEYSTLYGDAHRMGYYADPNAYNQMPAGAKFPHENQGQSASQMSTQALPATQASTQPMSSNTQQQQQYPMPFYYQYYMPGQFQSAYQSSIYPPQQFVNKSVYPYNGAPTTNMNTQGGKANSASGGPSAYYGGNSQHPYQPVNFEENHADYGKHANYGQGFQNFGLNNQGNPANVQGELKKGNRNQNYEQKYQGSNQANATTTAYQGMPQGIPIPQQGGYPGMPHMMHQPYQGLYGNRAQQQQYWNGQS